jgi:hypothetical protein
MEIKDSSFLPTSSLGSSKMCGLSPEQGRWEAWGEGGGEDGRETWVDDKVEGQSPQRDRELAGELRQRQVPAESGRRCRRQARQGDARQGEARQSEARVTSASRSLGAQTSSPQGALLRPHPALAARASRGHGRPRRLQKEQSQQPRATAPSGETPQAPQPPASSRGRTPPPVPCAPCHGRSCPAAWPPLVRPRPALSTCRGPRTRGRRAEKAREASEPNPASPLSEEKGHCQHQEPRRCLHRVPKLRGDTPRGEGAGEGRAIPRSEHSVPIDLSRPADSKSLLYLRPRRPPGVPRDGPRAPLPRAPAGPCQGCAGTAC